MTNKEQGNIGETIAMCYYGLLGYSVSKPIFEHSHYDLIVDDGDTLMRVQVKTSSYKSKYGKYQVALKTTGGNKSGNGIVKKINSNKVDVIFVYTMDGNLYEIPAIDVHNMGAVNLSPDSKYYIKHWSSGGVGESRQSVKLLPLGE